MTGELLSKLHGHGENLTGLGREDRKFVRTVSISQDGSYVLSGGYDKTARLWDARKGKTLHVWQVGVAPAFLSISPDGRLAFSHCAGGAALWEVVTGERVTLLKGKGFTTGSFSPDGRMTLIGDIQGNIHLWSVGPTDNTPPIPPAPLASVEPLRGHRKTVRCVAFSPDGQRLVSGALDNEVRVWNVKSGQELALLSGHEHFVEAVAFTADGKRIVSAARDGTVRVWDADAAVEVDRFRAYDRTLFQQRPKKELLKYQRPAALSPCGEYAVFAQKGFPLRLWHVAEKRELGALQEINTALNSLRFSLDGREMLFRDGEHLRLWDVANAREIRSFANPGRGRIAAGMDAWWFMRSSDDAAELVNLGTGRRVSRFDRDDFRRWHVKGLDVWSPIALSPDGRWGFFSQVAAIYEGLGMANARSGEFVKRIRGKAGMHGDTWVFAFSPDCRVAAIGGFSDGSIRFVVLPE